MKIRNIWFACTTAALALNLVSTIATHGAIISQGSGATLRYGYGATAGGIDANTAHLWQFDESGAPFFDSTTISGNAVNLNSVSGTAVIPSILKAAGGETNNARNFTGASNQIRNSPDMLPAQWNSMLGANMAFTVDFMVRPNFAPGSTPTPGSSGMRIFTSEGGTTHLFACQWNPLNVAGGGAAANRLKLSVGPFVSSWFDILVDIPLAGDNAFTAANQWFHVGFAYDGTDVKFYWTKVDGPDTALALATTQANLVTTINNPGAPTVLTTGGVQVGFGNRGGATTSNRVFSGALDMVRFSSVARGANEFIFAPAAHSGDFDGDGDVDGADFVAWQTNFPKASGATLAEGDADDDDDVDGADFAAWQNSFPFTPGPGVTSTPEPASGVLFAIAGLFAVIARKRNR